MKCGGATIATFGSLISRFRFVGLGWIGFSLPLVFCLVASLRFVALLFQKGNKKKKKREMRVMTSMGVRAGSADEIYRLNRINQSIEFKLGFE